MIRILVSFVFAISSVSCQSQQDENRIVLVNVGTLDRGEIAKVIEVIISNEPKVLAIDLFFSKDTENSKDVLLLSALEKVKCLVMITTIEEFDGKKKEYPRFGLGSRPEYLFGATTGYANTILDDIGKLVLRRFTTFEMVGGALEYHFSVATAMAYDSLTAHRFVKNHPRTVNVYFKKRSFLVLSSSDVLRGKISRTDIAGKIVMIGYLGPGDDDKFFSPLNAEMKSPDMYGLEFLAHIVSQILDSR